MLPNNTNILNFEFKVTLIYLNIYMQMLVDDVTTASLLRRRSMSKEGRVF
jgi:hypothetical protein